MQYLIPEKREKPCSKEKEMYRKTCQNKELPEIGLYFAGRLNPENRTQTGEKINFYFDPERIHLFDKDTEENLFYREEMR